MTPTESEVRSMDYRWRGLDAKSTRRLIFASLESRTRHFCEEHPDSSLFGLCKMDLGGLTFCEAVKTSSEAMELVKRMIMRYRT